MPVSTAANSAHHTKPKAPQTKIAMWNQGRWPSPERIFVGLRGREVECSVAAAACNTDEGAALHPTAPQPMLSDTQLPRQLPPTHKHLPCPPPPPATRTLADLQYDHAKGQEQAHGQHGKRPAAHCVPATAREGDSAARDKGASGQGGCGQVDGLRQPGGNNATHHRSQRHLSRVAG